MRVFCWLISPQIRIYNKFDTFLKLTYPVIIFLSNIITFGYKSGYLLQRHLFQPNLLIFSIIYFSSKIDTFINLFDLFYFTWLSVF